MVKYDFSKFKEMGFSEKDFIFEVSRISGIDSIGIESNQNRRVTVILEDLGVSVGYEGYTSQLKNKEVALNLMYSLLKEIFRNPNSIKKENRGEI